MPAILKKSWRKLKKSWKLIVFIVWLLVTLLILKFEYLTVHNSILIYFAVSFPLFLIMLSVFLYTKNPNNEKIWLKAFIDFVSAFYRGSTQRAKLFYLLVVVFIVPFLIMYFSDNGWNIIKVNFNPKYTVNPVAFWGIWLTILSIFISSRIYFEIVDKKKHNLEEFLTNVTQFLHETNSDNEVYLILPTLYIGASEYKGRFFNNFKEKLIAICNDKKKKISITMLEYKDKATIVYNREELELTLEELCNKLNSRGSELEGIKIL